MLLHRFNNETRNELFEKIFNLRLQRHSWAEIAGLLGVKPQHIYPLYRRECSFRKEALAFPFIEYISPATAGKIKRSLGADILSTPEKLADMQNLKTLIFWPGVGAKIMHDLALGLTEAGYASFDYDRIYEGLFKPK